MLIFIILLETIYNIDKKIKVNPASQRDKILKPSDIGLFLILMM